MKTFIQNIFFFTLFLVLCAMSLYGVIISPLEFSRSVGSYQFGVFDNGLALHPASNRFFYTASPFNDYVIDAEEKRTTFFTKEDIELKKVSSDFEKSKWEKIKAVFLHYFGISKPEIHFTGENDVEYESEISGNIVTIKRKVNLRGDPQIRKLGTTLIYRGGDFIFDKSGNLYTFQFPEDVTLFQKIYGIGLTLVVEGDRIAIPNRTVFLMNPDISGVIAIRASQNQTIWVNRVSRLIEIEEDPPSRKSGYYHTEIHVSLFDNPREAIHSL